MKQLCKMVLLLVLVALIAAPVAAQEKTKKKRKQAQPQRGPVVALMKKLEKAALTGEQKEKIKAIGAKYEPDLKELAAKAKMTPELQKAAAEARQKATEAGKKGKELREAVDAALNLTGEQKEARDKMQELTRKMQQEVVAVLTPEQRKLVGMDQKKGDAGKKRGGKKKQADK